MGAPWSITARGAAGVAPTAAQAAPGSAAGSQAVRLRALQVSIAAGATAGMDQVVVRDGATGVGTVLWQADLAVPANGTASISVADLDLRATVGNALTVEFVAGGPANSRENVNAQGDFVAPGFQAFATPGS